MNTPTNIRNDLSLILILAVSLVVILGALVYADAQTGMIQDWASQFYGLVLRQ